jgi:hypothetical protein
MSCVKADGEDSDTDNGAREAPKPVMVDMGVQVDETKLSRAILPAEQGAESVRQPSAEKSSAIQRRGSSFNNGPDDLLACLNNPPKHLSGAGDKNTAIQQQTERKGHFRQLLSNSTIDHGTQDPSIIKASITELVKNTPKIAKAPTVVSVVRKRQKFPPCDACMAQYPYFKERMAAGGDLHHCYHGRGCAKVKAAAELVILPPPPTQPREPKGPIPKEYRIPKVSHAIRHLEDVGHLFHGPLHQEANDCGGSVLTSTPPLNSPAPSLLDDELELINSGDEYEPEWGEGEYHEPSLAHGFD